MQMEEINSIINFIFDRSGYDFRNYSPATLSRRLSLFQAKHRLEDGAQFLSAIREKKELLIELIDSITVQVTEMFRDPEFYLALRNLVVEVLRTYPRIKIWHAGCANGAEVYSMAILLQEENLLHRCRIYATDIAEDALQQAQEGVYPLRDMQLFTTNYQKAGGKGSFADYYRADNASATMDKDLRKNIVFSFHNLATDWVFTEAHLVLCRNVLIYFNKSLQARVLDLFQKSLVRRGVLCLGTKESLRFSPVADSFDILESTQKIYRLKG